MIDTELYIAFVLATVLLILMPGPIVTITIANSLAYGARHGLRTVVGTSSATALDSGYALLCGRLRPYLTDARRGKLRNRITGSLMIGTGLALAFARKT